jgi:hypothetical protein
MYAFTVPAELVGDRQTDIGDLFREESETPERFAYWRKFNNLHGWMERLYRKKAGQGEFNCDTVRLMPEDLDQLLADAETLEPTAGFFFGSQDPMSEGDVAAVKDFVAKAKAHIAEGKAVFYDSWW